VIGEGESGLLQPGLSAIRFKEVVPRYLLALARRIDHPNPSDVSRSACRPTGVFARSVASWPRRWAMRLKQLASDEPSLQRNLGGDRAFIKIGRHGRREFAETGSGSGCCFGHHRGVAFTTLPITAAACRRQRQTGALLHREAGRADPWRCGGEGPKCCWPNSTH